MTGRLAVVGASLAGLRAVEAARRTGFTGPISLIGAESHLPYNRPPLSKAVLDAGSSVDVLFKDKDYLVGQLGVDLALGCPADALDTVGQTVGVGGKEIPYERLVIATGSNARLLPGSEGIGGVHALRTLDDALAVRQALDAGARTVIVGCGFIGAEIASAAGKRGLDATIVEAAAVPLERAVRPEVGQLLAGLHERGGTRLLCGVKVDRLVTDEGRVRAVRLDDGRVLDADLVVVGIGADPATAWLDDSGLELTDGIRCDDTLAVIGASSVYAAGDVARWENSLFDRSMRIEHWSNAAEQGAAAARNAVSAEQARPFTTVPYFWSDWYDDRIQFVGLPDGDEVRVVDGDLTAGRLVALYRGGDRLRGALTLNGQAVIMKYRALIGRRGSWAEALDLTASIRKPGAPGTL